MTKRKGLTIADVNAFKTELEKQTDRGVGIVGAAIVEDILEWVIECRLTDISKTRLESLFGRMRPLSSFSAKIELGMALGLYDDPLRIALNVIRDVRNQFAHEMEALDFNYSEISKLILATRSPHIKEDLSVRNSFITMVYAALVLLQAEGQEDIRIKPLVDTHRRLFLQLATHAQEMQQAQGSTHKGPQLPEKK